MDFEELCGAKYDWRVRKVAESYPSVSMDIIAEVLVQCRNDIATSIILMGELFSDLTPVVQSGWVFKGTADTPAARLHVPSYWNKYWSINACHWPCKMSVAQDLLFDGDEAFMYMTEQEGFVEIDARLNQMFDKLPKTASKAHKANQLRRY